MEFMTVYQFDTELSAFRGKVGELKRELMLGTVSGQKRLEDWKLNAFKAELKGFLHRAKVYGDTIAREIRTINLPDDGTTIRTIPYDLIKELIFMRPDYRSIGGFVSGLVQGTGPDGILKKPTDVEAFFIHTAEMAFKLNVESTGELLEKYQFIRDAVEPMTKLDRKLFNSLGGYPDMFKVTDVGDIFTSVARSLTAMINYLEQRTGGSTDQRLVDIAALNAYCEYLNFTLTTYLGRTFMIGYYFAPIWYRLKSNDGDTMKAFDEAASEMELTGSAQFQPLRELETGTVTDPKSLMIFLNVYRQFVTMINRGVPKGIPDGDNDYAWDSKLVRSAFERVIIDAGLDDNVLLRKVIRSDDYYAYSEQRDEVSLNLTELYHNLKSSLGASKQGLQLKGSAKDDLIRVITSANGVKTLADVRKLAADSLILSAGVLTNLRHKLTRLQGSIIENIQDATSTIGNPKLISECHLMCLELYRDLASASYDKAVMLDKLYRHFVTRENDAILKATELDLQGLISSQQTQAPMTMRVSDDMLPKYQQPILEYLELKTEYLRSLPEFEDDLYLSEAGDSALINALLSLVEGLIASVTAFFKNFKPAASWVKSREADLRAMEFTDKDQIVGVHRYKVGNYDDLIKGLSLNSIKANLGKPSDQFTASLYPSTEIFGWFRDDKKAAAIRYRNHYLFGQSTTEEIKTVTVSGKDLTAMMGEWIDDVLTSETAMAKLKRTGDDLRAVVKYLRTEVVKVEPVAPAKQPQASSESAPNVPDEKAPKAGQPGTPKAQPATAEAKPTAPTTEKPESSRQPDDRLIRVQNAINNLWKPVSDGLVKVLRDEYGYLKQAYALGQSGSETKAQPSKPETKSGV